MYNIGWEVNIGMSSTAREGSCFDGRYWLGSNIAQSIVGRRLKGLLRLGWSQIDQHELRASCRKYQSKQQHFWLGESVLLKLRDMLLNLNWAQNKGFLHH